MSEPSASPITHRKSSAKSFTSNCRKSEPSYDSGDTFGSVESVKAVSELFLPVSGEVIEVNEDLGAAPEKINEDPYGTGWMIQIRLTDPRRNRRLMSAEEYDEYTAKRRSNSVVR